MTRITFLATAAAILGAIALAGAAHSLSNGSSTTHAIAVPASPATRIDVFELMGRTLGDMPAESHSMH